MTNSQIRDEMLSLVKAERKHTIKILNLIVLAKRQKAYIEFGFPNLHTWLNKGLKYSSGATMRRIDAARIIEAVPEAAKKLEEGSLRIGILSKIQCAVRAEEKSGVKVTAEKKAQAVNAVENLSGAEAEQALMVLFPAAKSNIKYDRHIVIDPETIRHCMNLTNEATADLKRVKELISHTIPYATDGEAVAYALDFLLDKKDPLRRDAPSAADVADVQSKAEAYREALRRADGQCTFHDPESGQRCPSRHEVQVDHIIPRALGGTDDLENLRALCRPHNIYMAEMIFGKEVMDSYRRDDPD